MKLLSQVPHPLINEKFICQCASYSHILAPLHSFIEREQHEKTLLATIRKYGRSMHDSAHPYNQWATVKRRRGWLRFVFSIVQHCTENLKQKDSVINTSAITAVTKSSMKPQSGTTANHHLRGSGERNKEQRRTKVSFGRTMMWALELLRLQKGTSRDKATLNSEEIKPIALVVIELYLSEGISQSDSQSYSKSVEKSVQ